jgi:hypothetical protein
VKNKSLSATTLVAIILLSISLVGCAGFTSSKSGLAAPAILSITGTISPTAGGTAAMVTLSGPITATTSTDSFGNYTFAGLPSGTYTVTPSKNKFHFSPASQNTILSAAAATGVNFLAATGATAQTYSISGKITPTANGGESTVTLSGAASAITTADASGNYTFGGLSNGTYSVTPSKGGFTFNPAGQNETISNANVNGVNFTATQVAPPTYSITGTISPAASGSGATVTLSGAASATTTANSSGVYTFTGLSSGSYFVTPSKSGFTFSPSSQGASITNANVTGMNFTATQNPPQTYSVTGTISPAANGSGATVTLSGAASATTTANSSGVYTFTGLSSGSYFVTPSKSGFTFSPSSQGASITNANVTGMNFTATQNPPQTYSIMGTISPAANGSGATVTLSGAGSATTTANSSGVFTFTGLSSGSYSITASKNGYTFSPSTQGATITNANVTGENFTATQNAPQTYSITGTVDPTASGSGATVTLSGAASATTTANSSGVYAFTGLSSGNYSITPSKSGFTFNPPTLGVTITSASATGENFTASTVSSPSAGLMISGTVAPITIGTGVKVTLGGAASATTTTDSSGNYAFSNLGNGSYTLTATKTGYSFSPSTQTTTLSAASATQVNFAASSQSAIVNISAGQDIPSIVAAAPAGTTFIIAAGTYRLTAAIIPKNGDTFVGQTPCAPPATACSTILTGSTVIGTQAKFNGTNYEVTGQTQQGAIAVPIDGEVLCDANWQGCIYPEDLFFDGVPYKHLNSATLPVIGAGQWWFDYTNHIIYFHDNPTGHTVETSVLNNAFGGSANYVTIQYLTLRGFADMYPVGTIAVNQGRNAPTMGANWTVQYNEVLLNHGFGVRVNYNMHIVDNYLHNNGQTGIGGGIGTTSATNTESMNSGILIQNNLITYNDYAHFNPDFGAGGIKTGSTSGIIIRGNTIQHNEGSAVHFDDNSQNELLDGNIITDNTDSDGVNQEIGYGTSAYRNNIVLRNGAQVNEQYFTGQLTAHASAGVSMYCNTMEVPAGPGVSGAVIAAANRGNSSYPPYQYLVATANSFHHNTVIWDNGATGSTGYWQDDAAHQPDFFADNGVPDYNTYHTASSSQAAFVYDNNNSQNNRAVSFASYQATGAESHGSADANNTSGYPTVAITSPLDQASYSSSVGIAAAASDASGISKVEFYLDWALKSTVTAAPFNFTLTGASAGQHTVAAMAYSNAGIRSCYAITVNAQ